MLLKEETSQGTKDNRVILKKATKVVKMVIKKTRAIAKEAKVEDKMETRVANSSHLVKALVKDPRIE